MVAKKAATVQVTLQKENNTLYMYLQGLCRAFHTIKYCKRVNIYSIAIRAVCFGTSLQQLYPSCFKLVDHLVKNVRNNSKYAGYVSSTGITTFISAEVVVAPTAGPLTVNMGQVGLCHDDAAEGHTGMSHI